MSCTNCPAMGVFVKLLLEPGASPHTFDANSERYEILPPDAEDFQRHGRLIGGQGITGKMYRLKSRVRDGGYYVYGKFRLNPSPGYLNTLLPKLVGDEVTDVFSPNTCPNVFGALLHRDVDVWKYLDGRVARWELTGRAPQFREQATPDLLLLEVDVLFEDEAGFYSSPAPTWPVSEPDLPTGTSYAPYIFQDCDGGVTLNGEVREIYAFKLTYENNLSIRYANSLTASSICPTGRKVALECALPWTVANQDLYDQGYAGAAAEMIFTYTNGGDTHSTTINVENLKVPDESPHVYDENEVAFSIRGEAYGDESTDAPEITVTNVIG